MRLAWSNKLSDEQRKTVKYKINGHFNFQTSLDGYATLAILLCQMRIQMFDKKSDKIDVLINELNWYMMTFLQFLKFPEFDFSEESYKKQTEIFSVVKNLELLSGIGLEKVDGVSKSEVSLVLLPDLDEDLENEMPLKKCYSLILKTLEQASISNELKILPRGELAKLGAPVNCKSVYGCHERVKSSFTMLMSAVVYFHNSSSLRDGEYYLFDRAELNQRKYYAENFLNGIRYIKA